MKPEQHPEHLRLRIECVQDPAPQPRTGADPEHQAAEASRHPNYLPVINLVSRQILMLEGLGKRQRLPKTQ